MKNSLLRRSLLVVTLCTLFSTANAGSNTKFQPFGGNDSQSEHSYYLGGSIGSTAADNFCLSGNNCEDSAKSWKAYGGYHLTELLTLEGGYVNLGELGRQPNSESDDPTKIAGYTASLMASFPIQEKMHLFGKAGFFKQKTDDDNIGHADDIKPVYGVGADYEVGEGIAIRAEWENYKNVRSENDIETANIQMVTMGMTFSSL